MSDKRGDSWNRGIVRGIKYAVIPRIRFGGIAFRIAKSPQIMCDSKSAIVWITSPCLWQGLAMTINVWIATKIRYAHFLAMTAYFEILRFAQNDNVSTILRLIP